MLFQKVCKLAAIITVSLLTFTGIAVAEDFDNDKNSILKGSYLVSGNQYCVVANADGFDENLILISGGSTNSMAIEGEYIFNGDGTGSSFQNWQTIYNNSLNPGQRPLNYGTVEADFTYTVNMDGTFEMTAAEATVTGHYGLQATIDGYGTMTGVIASGQKTFTYTDVNPNIETIHTASGDRERICHRTKIGIKIE